MAVLRRYGILDTPAEASYDDVTRLIAHICEMPIAVINLIDDGRQWFKSEIGLGVRETPLDPSICAHAILQPGLFVVPDTLLDPRFSDNPLVTGEPHLRFYAGALLETPEGHTLGTLCVLDTVPRELTRSQRDALRTLARHVMAMLELRRSHAAQRLEDERRLTVQRLQSVGTLAGGVAHEVNNMMSVVLGFGEFALAGLGAGHPQYADVAEMVRAAHRAARITQQLLVFSRQALLQPVTLDLSGVVRDLQPLLEQIVGADKAITLRLAPSTAAVYADRIQLEQVLVNLCLNARDAMDTTGRLTIETGEGTLGDDPGQYVSLVVSDTGCGMDESTMARAFEPFFTTKPVGQGTGLGLSTVYGVIAQSGGHVRLESAVGKGTTVRVYLPAAPVPEASSSTMESSVPPTGSEVILIAEDEPAVRTMARRALESHGYTVLEAANGQEALDIVDHGPDVVDLVLCDVIMPVLDGRELGRRLAERRPPTPLLYMSGYPGEEMVDRDLMARGAPFLQKPFTPETLALAVRSYLDASVTGSDAAIRAAGEPSGR